MALHPNHAGPMEGATVAHHAVGVGELPGRLTTGPGRALGDWLAATRIRVANATKIRAASLTIDETGGTEGFRPDAVGGSGAVTHFRRAHSHRGLSAAAQACSEVQCPCRKYNKDSVF